MDVSIIIVNYNSFKLLQDCLESIFKHSTGFDFEIIIVDNNSSEGNIDTVVQDFDKITLIKNDVNKGFGAANNQGLAIAKGKYVLFLNNDTTLLENSLKKVYDFAESVNEPIIVGCKLLNQDKTLQYSVYDFPTVWNVFTSNFFLYALFPRSKIFNKYHLMNKKIDEISEVDVVTGAFLFATKNKIVEIDSFDERFFFYNEETDLCYRFKQNGGKIFYYPQTAIIHVKGGTAKKNLRFKYLNESVATIKYYQKHFKWIKFFAALIFHYTGILVRIPILFLLGLVSLNRHFIIRSYYFSTLLWVYPKNLFKQDIDRD